MASNHEAANPAAWDLKTLTLVAFYYRPALAEARAQLLASQAAAITAGQRPNPGVTVTPGYDNQIPGAPSSWIVPINFDLPIETAGKRKKRVVQAEHLAEAARWNLVGAVWQTRSQIRAALVNYYYARQLGALLALQEAAQSNIVRLLEGQMAAGSISEVLVTQAQIELDTTQLAEQDALGRFRQAQVDLAHALGLPTPALEKAEISFGTLERLPENLTRADIRRQALVNRADVRGALSEYQASQSALQLEIANQYPDVRLGPGYGWNTGSAGDNEWTLGLTITLPLLNHNQGPVAEAEAKRAQAAAHFLRVQSDAEAEIDGALAGYKAALAQMATAKRLLGNLTRRLNSVRALEQSGESDPLAVATAEAAFRTGQQSELDSLLKTQQALGLLEDAVESPLTLSAESVNAAEGVSANILP